MRPSGRTASRVLESSRLVLVKREDSTTTEGILIPFVCFCGDNVGLRNLTRSTLEIDSSLAFNFDLE